MPKETQWGREQEAITTLTKYPPNHPDDPGNHIARLLKPEGPEAAPTNDRDARVYGFIIPMTTRTFGGGHGSIALRNVVC